MNNYKQTEDWIRQSKPEIDTNATMDKRILSKAAAAVLSAQKEQSRHSQPVARRFFMRTTFRFTAAAVILIAAVLSLTIIDKTVAPAYALEQTINALNAMRSIHVKVYYPGYDEPVLVWAKWDQEGQIDSVRVSQSDSAPGDPHDGAKETVLKDNKAYVWIKGKNMVFHILDKTEAAKVGATFQEVNPKTLVQKLKNMQQEGTAQLEIEQPDEINQPIVITATLTQEDHLLGHQVTAVVDQATKLVISLRTVKGDWAFKNGHFGAEDFNLIEFFDYNQSFAEDIFTLDIPKDVAVVDQIERAIGLEQGQMSAKEAAVEVVRLFWDSIINEDFETAGLLYEGIPADIIKQKYQPQPEGKITRVQSIGEAQNHPNPEYAGIGFIVPCSIEVKKNNGEIERLDFNYAVIQVHGQPNRWTICGTW